MKKSARRGKDHERTKKRAGWKQGETQKELARAGEDKGGTGQEQGRTGKEQGRIRDKAGEKREATCQIRKGPWKNHAGTGKKRKDK